MPAAAALLVAAIAWGVPDAALADTNGHECTVGALSGLYVFSATGSLTPGSNPAQPKAILELIRFNGDGTLGVPGATLSLNGAISRVGPASSHLRSPAKALYARLLKAEVDRLRWAVKVIEVRAPDEIEGAVAEAASRRADALLVTTTFQPSRVVLAGG